MLTLKNTVKCFVSKPLFLLGILLLVFSGSAGISQIKSTGLLFIKNYTRNQYNAGTQNWDITQNDKGFIYFANNGGILEFDGSHWTIYGIPNNSIVRSVSCGNDGRIYAGAYNELGYLKELPSGRKVYQSLIDKIPKENRDFGEIWKIYQLKDEIVFQGFKYLFIFRNGKITVLKPLSTFSFSYVVHGKLFIVDDEHGLYTLEGETLEPFITDSPLFKANEVRFLLPLGNDSILVGFMNLGVYIINNKKLTSWKGDVNNQLKETRLYSGIALKSGYYAFGTIQDGLYITNSAGRIIQHINRGDGLQNNTVLSVFSDQSSNIWLGLDNGITFVEASSPSSVFNYAFGIETGYTSIVYKDVLYFGTNQGLFAHKLNISGKDFTQMEKFSILDGTQGQVWSLVEIDGKLFCGHNNGIYLINGFSATKISNIRGGWTFIQLQNDPNTVFCGTYTGLVVFRKNGAKGEWKYSHIIKGFSESCRKIVQDEPNSFWISHGYKGIFHLVLNEKMDSVMKIRLFTSADGLPAQLPYQVNRLNNHLVITTLHGCYVYEKEKDKLVPSAQYNRLFAANPTIREIQPDAMGNIWYFSDRRLGVYRKLEDGSYKEVFKPFLRFSYSFINSFEHMYAYNEKNIIVGIQDGFIHFDPTIVKDYGNNYRTFIRGVRILKDAPDSVISYRGDTGSPDIVKIKYRYNSLSFSFSAPFYEEPERTEYRYRLIGYSDQWSNWEQRSFREFTNLSEGQYKFEVQARNIYQNISKSDSFTFIISPPFYRSKVAYVVYLLFILGILGSVFAYIHYKHEEERRKDKIAHEKKLLKQEQKFKHETDIAEKEIERLNREKLLADVKHKNKELANSTMHIIQKNKFLNVLKDEMGQIVNSTSIDEYNKSVLRQLLKKIDKDLNNEKYFKVFDSYFDQVHQDFIDRFRAKHPALSPKELRLCAYLRMNITTKEIASLMNISIRGVEVSRYRLRKKLEIPHEANLTEYILNF